MRRDKIKMTEKEAKELEKNTTQKKENMYYNYLNTFFVLRQSFCPNLILKCRFLSFFFVSTLGHFSSSHILLLLFRSLSLFVCAERFISIWKKNKCTKDHFTINCFDTNSTEWMKKTKGIFVGSFRFVFFLFRFVHSNLISLFTHFLCLWNGNVSHSYISWHSKRMTSCHDVLVSLF